MWACKRHNFGTIGGLSGGDWSVLSFSRVHCYELRLAACTTLLCYMLGFVHYAMLVYKSLLLLLVKCDLHLIWRHWEEDSGDIAYLGLWFLQVLKHNSARSYGWSALWETARQSTLGLGLTWCALDEILLQSCTWSSSSSLPESRTSSDVVHCNCHLEWNSAAYIRSGAQHFIDLLEEQYLSMSLHVMEGPSPVIFLSVGGGHVATVISMVPHESVVHWSMNFSRRYVVRSRQGSGYTGN